MRGTQIFKFFFLFTILIEFLAFQREHRPRDRGRRRETTALGYHCFVTISPLTVSVAELS